MQEPRFLLDKDSICYGCPHYKHWTDSRDPMYWADKEDDMDEHGGVCDSPKPCFGGSLNTFKTCANCQNQCCNDCDKCDFYDGVECHQQADSCRECLNMENFEPKERT